MLATAGISGERGWGVAVLVQGQVRDRPWGQTLGALGLRALTGQLTLHAEDKDYAIAFELGGVIGAWSPNASDSAPRVALTNHLCSSSAVAQIARRITAQPERDEVDVVAEMARLTPDQVVVLREKLVAQRAARTFAVDDGAFTIEDEITIPIIPGSALDIRSVVYLGARMNLAEAQLGQGLRHFGSYFMLKHDAAGVLDRFGFSDAERTVLVELRAGTSLHELEAAHRDIDPRMVQAVVYALFACGACEISDAPAMPRAATVQVPGGAKPRAPSSPPALPAGYARPESAPYGPFVGHTSTEDRQANARAPRAESEGIDLPDPRSLPPDPPPKLDLHNPLPPEPEPEGVPTRLDLRNPRWSEPPPSRTDPRAPRPSVPALDLKHSRPPTEGADLHSPRTAPPVQRVELLDARPLTENPFPVGQGTPGRPTTENPFARTQGTPGQRMPTPNPFPMRTPTPPVTGRTPSDAEYPQRTPTSGPEFPMRTPTPPVRGRVSTENPFPLRTPTPPVMGRTATEHPFPMRTPTPPVESRTQSGRRAFNGPDEAGVPRNRSATTPPRTMTPTADPMNVQMGRANTPRPGGAPPAVSRTPSDQPAGDPASPRTRTTGPAISRTSTARKTAALIAARWILFEQGADHFSLLGVPFDAPVDLVRSTYLNLVRQLHPDKLAELEVDDPAGNAHKVFAAMGQAFSVLTDPTKRAEYIAEVTGDAPAPRTKTGDEVNLTPAMEAFRRGESALRRDEPHEAFVHFQKANELQPNDVDFMAMLGWAQFCAATDKFQAAPEARKQLERATQRSSKPLVARFLLGRVERMLGRDREALRQFQVVLEEQPSHAEARAEVRVIEARLSGSTGKKR